MKKKSSKILLIKPWSYVPSYFTPLGIGYIAAVLERNGYTVHARDLSVEAITRKDFKRSLANYEPDIVGISCMITEYGYALEVSRICKEVLPNTPTIVGGPMPSTRPDIFLNQPTIDVAVMGEGEITILEVLNRLENKGNLKGVKGIAYKEDGKIILNSPRQPIFNLDDIPFPARHLLPMNRYFSSFENWFAQKSEIRAINMISSRGCPYNCIYCDKTATGTVWRGRSPANIADEMQYLIEEYRVNGVIFSDDIFDIDKKRVYGICNEIDQRGLDIVWGVNSRANHGDEKLYRRMQRSGCRFVAFGIESGNQRILNFMRRGITLEHVQRAIAAAKRAGLRTLGYFMLGMLGEDETTIRETVDFAKKLDLDSGGFSRVVPLPGTELFTLAKGEGLIIDDTFLFMDTFGGNVSLARNISAKQLDRLVRQAYWEFLWSRPSRRLPKPICHILASLSPLTYRLMGGKIDLFVRLNRVREALRLPLP